MVEYPVHTRPVTCSSQVAATRPVGQAVKTPPFHGGNMGSIPVRVTKKESSSERMSFLFCLPVGIEEAGPTVGGVKKCPVDTFLGRGRFLRIGDASRRDVDTVRITGHPIPNAVQILVSIFIFCYTSLINNKEMKLWKKPPPVSSRSFWKF